MEYSLIHKTNALILCIALFIGMILMVLLGRWFGRSWVRNEDEPKGGMNSLLGAMFALFGFVLAFTFGMSGSRYENVGTAIQKEGNEISSAILCADLYPDSVRTVFREEFKKYLEAVIAYYEHAIDTGLISKARSDAAKSADNLWSVATRQSKLPNMLIASNNMIPALHDMFDIASTREVLLYSRVPDLIVYMLFFSALGMSFIGGCTSSVFKQRDVIVVIGFALLASTVVYITLDLGRPLRGVIINHAAQQAIVDIRKMF